MAMVRHKAARILRRVSALPGWLEALSLCPALALSWLWFGAPGVAVLASAALPVLLLAVNRSRRDAEARLARRAAMSDFAPLDAVVEHLDRACRDYERTGAGTVCLVVGLDEPGEVAQRFGQLALDRVVRESGARIRSALRQGDLVCRQEGARFVIALEPMQRMDLEAAIQVAGRLKAAVEEPVSIDATTAYVTASVGFCLGARAPGRDGRAALAAAELAFEEACRNGPGAIRAYSGEMGKAATRRAALRDQVEAALERGDIVAYFQPQISTDSGEVTGFEALARWQHPERGVLAPGEFLPAILACGLARRLSETMLAQSLAALRLWDRKGLAVPAVAVNFAGEELGDPNLVPRVKWELDRFDLGPERLIVEILETVIAESDNDIVTRNVAELSKLGCRIDLDDFGTGHASIAAIRRFAVNRLKIDRSFVARVDTDPAQQRLVAAILSMAERLGLETLGEGVETIGEHAHLAQLGCGHVQGYAIAHPMPLSATIEWLHKHRAKLDAAPAVTRRRR